MTWSVLFAVIVAAVWVAAWIVPRLDGGAS